MNKTTLCSLSQERPKLTKEEYKFSSEYPKQRILAMVKKTVEINSYRQDSSSVVQTVSSKKVNNIPKSTLSFTILCYPS